MNIQSILKTAAVKLPPLETLAALAGCMSSPQESPDSTAKRALALWKSCAVELEAATRSQSELKAVSEVIERKKSVVSALFGERKTLPFEEYLRFLMPGKNLKPEDRMRRYREYLRENIVCGRNRKDDENPTETEIDKIVASIISDEKAMGISSNNFEERANKTRQVLDSKKRERLSKRGAQGSKAQVAKKNALRVTEAEKVPQAKRKPRQAEDSPPRA